jgi:antitoxin MazE
MERSIHKWGNSLALRIPGLLASEAGISDKSVVDLTLDEGRLVITPIFDPEPRLAELLSRVTEENRHHETDTGVAVGGEVW